MARFQPGAKLPENLEIRVVAETPSTPSLVLPAKPRQAEPGELSDADLEAVAGETCSCSNSSWALTC